MKYRLEIMRRATDIGYVEVEAESREDALRKYFEPDISKGEELIFDSDIDWSCDTEYEYDAEVECEYDEDVAERW